MRTIERDIVSGHIYSGDGKLLLARNTHPEAGVVYGDCWKIPGGGVETGETKIQTLVREVQEESGIDITPFGIELVDNSMIGEAEKVLRESGEKVLAKMKFFTYKVTLDKPAAQISVTLDGRHPKSKTPFLSLFIIHQLGISLQTASGRYHALSVSSSGYSS